MGDPSIAELQRALRSERAQCAWTDFLEGYGPIILQAVRRTIWDSESAADCFVFVCEQLSARGYRRLLQFKPGSGTSFVTWLRVVVRNLSLDWYRKQVGRHRKFESVERLPLLHQEIYRFRYQEGRSLDETYLALRGRFPQLTSDAVSDADAELRQSLSSRQEWLLVARRSDTVTLDSTDSTDSPPIDLADPTRGPEACAISHEEWQRLGRGLAKLDAPERLLLQLRFGRGATLAKIARLVGLPDAQTADRRIRATLDRLRKELE
jgi:RNA polymerase sigma factor (sigma-70 family)